MKRTFLYALPLLLLLGGCGESGFPPEEINPEKDACEVCNMSIIEEAYATEVIAKDGTVYKFDDIGCMVKFLQDEKGKTMEKSDLYVRDFESLEWVHLEDAYHVYHPDTVTPMAYGVVSFSSKERAEEFRKQLQGESQLYNMEQLFQHQWDVPE